jgi:hypothetical protein
MTAKLGLLAKKMQPTSALIGTNGRAIRDKANSVDVSIRHLVRIGREDDVPALTNGVRDFLKKAKDGLGDTAAVVDQMNGLLNSMSTAEATSTLIRNSLKPMRSGILSLNDAIAVMQKWGPELLD